MRIRSTRSNLAGVDLVPFPNVTIDQNGGFGGKTRDLRCIFLMLFLGAYLFKLYVVYEIYVSNIFCMIVCFVFLVSCFHKSNDICRVT